MKKARNIKEQLINICSKVGINVEDENLSINNENTSMNIRKCIVSGFFLIVLNYVKMEFIEQLKIHILFIFILVLLYLKKIQDGLFTIN
jgi:hypothetical protein